MADEQEQVVGRGGVHLKHRAIGDHGEILRRRGVEDVGVAAGDSAEFKRIGCGPEAGGHGRIVEAQRARRQKRLRVLACGANKHFQCAAFHFISAGWINEMARGQDGGSRREDLRLPRMRKGEIDGRHAGVHRITPDNHPRWASTTGTPDNYSCGVYSRIQHSCSKVSGTRHPRAARTASKASPGFQPISMSVQAVVMVARPMLPRQ